MTIKIKISRPALPDGIAERVRPLFEFVEPVALALADAFGVGLLLQLGLDVGFRFVRHALQE